MTKKQLIIDVAIDLFAEKGIEATSIQQITDKCGISKGAFYLIFKSKEELILSIIDFFMQSFAEKIDQSVNSVKNNDEKLYQYFLTSLHFFDEHKSLAQIFFREQLSTVGEKCIERLMYYEALGTQLLLHLVEDLYGDQVEQTKYDLILIMQSMLNGYIGKVLITNLSIHYEQLAHMLVEKTNILAEHSKLSVMTSDFLLKYEQSPIQSNLLIEELQALALDVTSPIEQESIAILIDQLQQEKPSEAILLGVATNLSSTMQGKWISTLIRNFVETI